VLRRPSTGSGRPGHPINSRDAKAQREALNQGEPTQHREKISLEPLRSLCILCVNAVSVAFSGPWRKRSRLPTVPG
jgi:hypothetical protein